MQVSSYVDLQTAYDGKGSLCVTVNWLVLSLFALVSKLQLQSTSVKNKNNIQTFIPEQ